MKNLVVKVSLLLLGIFLTITAKGDDLFIYGTDGSKQSFPLDEISKLTFTNEIMEINKTDGTSTTVAFNLLKFFSLKDYQFSNIKPVIKGMIKVYPNPVINDVIVNNEQAITSVTLSNLQGQKLLELFPGTTEINIPLTSFSAGIYLLQVTDKNGTTIQKIIKK